jgi:hypothetical protein
VRASVGHTNGTSLSPEALQRPTQTELCNHTRLAYVRFLSGSPESPFFVPFFRVWHSISCMVMPWLRQAVFLPF